MHEAEKIPYYFFFAMLILQVSCHSGQGAFWELKNQDASLERVEQVQTTLSECNKGLKSFFKDSPGKLLVLTYGTRPSFVDGLKQELSFSEASVEFFRDKSAPRPLQGKYLIPPDQSLKNICHEIVHHYLESNTKRETLLNAKWFDEGTAGYFAQIYFEKDHLVSGKKWLKEKDGTRYLHLDQITTNNQWSDLKKDMEQRNVAYVQAAQMMQFFFTKYSQKDFQNILTEMKSVPFESAFEKVTGVSVERFYQSWVSDLEL